MIVHILSLNDDDDDAKALPTGVLKDDAMKKGGWGGQNVSKSDGVILVCSLNRHLNMVSQLETRMFACKGTTLHPNFKWTSLNLILWIFIDTSTGRGGHPCNSSFENHFYCLNLVLAEYKKPWMMTACYRRGLWLGTSALIHSCLKCLFV